MNAYLEGLSAWDESTIIAALVHYGLSCNSGDHCVAALRSIGHGKAADTLAFALSHRDADAPHSVKVPE